MNDPKRKAEETNPNHRKYRLNKKKFVVMLLVLGCTAAFIVVAVNSLANVADVDAVAVNMNELPESVRTVGSSPTQQIVDGQDGSIVVLDAGHGGFDPGAIGVGGMHEDDLNLAVTQYLKTEFEDSGVKVIMTREDEDAVAGDKEGDMAERRRIIEESGSDIVISIHMNSFPQDPGVSGPLVLFMPGSEQGKRLAESIQQSLNEALEAKGKARSQSLYVLESGSQPCALVECGYLSNEEEERKLNRPDYQKKVAKAICKGAKDFF